MTVRQTYTSCLLKILFNLLINERMSKRLKPGQMRFRLTGIYILHWMRFFCITMNRTHWHGSRQRMFAWLSIFYTFTSICTKLNTSPIKSNQRCTHLYRIWYSWMIWGTTDQHFIGRILIVSFAHFQTFGHFPSIPILQCVRGSLRVSSHPTWWGGSSLNPDLTWGLVQPVTHGPS